MDIEIIIYSNWNDRVLKFHIKDNTRDWNYQNPQDSYIFFTQQQALDYH